MSKYFTQFDEAAQVIGTNLTGWSVEVGGTPGRAPAYGVVPIKRRYLPLTVQTAGTNILLSWDAIDADANRDKFDLLTCLVLPLTTTDDSIGLFARQSSGINNVYFGLLNNAGGLTIYKVVAGVGATVAAVGFTVDPAKSYFLRFNGNGTALKLRAWDAALGMAGEPTTWNISTTDPSLTAAGNVGVTCYDASGTGEVAAFNFLAVGTNGDTAVCPRTNAEVATAFASKQFQPVLLAELTATGYDSGGAPYTTVINAYISNHDYRSHEQDTPSRKAYRGYISKIPTIRRQIGTGMSGEVSIDFGDLEIRNMRTVSGGPGVLDEWLRSYWERDYVRMYLGAPSWPKHDFRPVLVGRLGIPTAPAPSIIKFPVAGLSDALNVPIQSSKFSSGERINQYKPKLFGVPYMVEPAKTDLTNLVYSVSDGYWANTGETVFDNGVSLTTDAVSVTSVNTGTGEITLSAVHGMVDGYRAQWIFGTPPMGMTLASVYYYVVGTTPGTNKLKLSLTLGGAAITGGAGTTGGLLAGFGWRFDNGTGELTLAAANAGRIMVQYARYDADSSLLGMGSIYASALSALGISANFIDTASLTALKAVETTDVTGQYGFWFDTQLHLGTEVMKLMAEKSFTWYSFSPDGLFQAGKIALPSSTAVASFTEGNVIADTLKLVEVIRAVDFTQAECTYEPWYVTGGPLQNAGQLESPFAQQAEQLKTFLAVGSYSGAGTPLDNYPNNTDATVGQRFDFATTDAVIAANMRDKLKTLYQKRLGIYQFDTHIGALFTSTGPLSIGDTISLTHSRLGFKNYSAGTASPDNSGSFDATKAVVCGIETNLKDKVTLRIYRQIPGYYPTTDLN